MHLTEINVYPVKSLRGTAVREATVCADGLEHDRRWMLINAESQKLTQRECPRLATLVPHLEDGHLRVEIPGSPDVQVRLDSSWTGQQVTIDLWGHEHIGVVAVDAVNQGLSDALGMSCRLVSFRGNLAKNDTGAAFHDDAPILIISQASLDELNRRLPTPLPMNRFRPSLVVTGSGSFEEDSWQRIAIGETKFGAVKQCVRCAITTVDQAAGEFRGPEPLKTLATFRRIEQNVAFGAYFRPESAGTRVRLGDELRVLEAKPSSASAPG